MFTLPLPLKDTDLSSTANKEPVCCSLLSQKLVFFFLSKICLVRFFTLEMFPHLKVMVLSTLLGLYSTFV